MDIAYRTSGNALSEAVTALESGLAVDLDDFFTFQLTAVPSEGNRNDDRTLPFRVDALIGGRPWVTFGIDLGVADDRIATDPVRARGGLTGVAQVDQLPELRALTMAHQVAQKACALFELHGAPPKHSARARDLIDLAMVADRVEDLRAHARAGCAARQPGGLARRGGTRHLRPTRVRAQVGRWSWTTGTIWTKWTVGSMVVS